MGDQCSDTGGGNKDRQLVERGQIEYHGRSRRSMSNQAEQRQSGRQANSNNDHANALHNRDCAQVSAELGTECQHL